MRCKPRTLAFAILFACIWLPTQAATTCIDADVSIDAAHRALTLQLTLPPGTDTLAMKPLDGYRRSQLLRSPDGSAVVTDQGLQLANPRQRRLRVQMDVHNNLDRPDRTYPPFLRFADGTIALETDTLAAARGAAPLYLHPPVCRRRAADAGRGPPRALQRRQNHHRRVRRRFARGRVGLPRHATAVAQTVADRRLWCTLTSGCCYAGDRPWGGTTCAESR